MPLATCLLLAACGGSAAPATPASGQAGSKPAAKTKVTIFQGLPLGNASNPFLWIGQELGYFDEEGVTPDFVVGGGDNAKGTAMLASSQIDGGIFGLELILRGAASGNNVPAKAVFNVQSKSQYEGVVLADSPIKTVADLKGRTVAIPQLGATQETYVNALLVDVGLKAGDAKFLATGTGPPMGEALKRGEAQAAFGTFGQVSPLSQQGINIRYLPRPGFAEKFITGNFVVRDNMTPDQVNAMKGYLRAYAKSIVFDKQNPEAAIRISWKMYPEAKPKNQPEDQALKDAIELNNQYMAYIDKLDGKWGYMPPEYMRIYAKYLDVDPKVDVTKYYSNDWIEFINNFDETKVKQQADNYKVS